MKKILLGTTGLVGAALIASAASAETPKVTLGGFSDFQAGFVSDKSTGAGQQDYGFRNDNEVTIKVDGKTNNGLSYGAEIDLEADTTADADNQGLNASRTFTYLSGKWGRAEMGGNKSAAATMRVDASSLAVATGGINGAWTYFLTGAPAAGTGFISTSKLPGEHGSTRTFGDESTYNATKISYYTPTFAGAQLGVSYTPSITDRGQTVGRVDNSGLSDVFDVAASYNREFGAWKLSSAASYEHASGNNAPAVTALGTPTLLYGTNDVNAWNAGALLSYQAFSVAASYGQWNDSGIASVEGEYYTAGLGYSAGPVGLSATYLNSSLDETTTGSNDFSNVVLGAEYKLAPGLTPYAEVSFFDFNSGATTAYNNKGTSVILGTQLAF